MARYSELFPEDIALRIQGQSADNLENVSNLAWWTSGQYNTSLPLEALPSIRLGEVYTFPTVGAVQNVNEAGALEQFYAFDENAYRQGDVANVRYRPAGEGSDRVVTVLYIGEDEDAASASTADDWIVFTIPNSGVSNLTAGVGLQADTDFGSVTLDTNIPIFGNGDATNAVNDGGELGSMTYGEGFAVTPGPTGNEDVVINGSFARVTEFQTGTLNPVAGRNNQLIDSVEIRPQDDGTTDVIFLDDDDTIIGEFGGQSGAVALLRVEIDPTLTVTNNARYLPGTADEGDMIPDGDLDDLTYLVDTSQATINVAAGATPTLNWTIRPRDGYEFRTITVDGVARDPETDGGVRINRTFTMINDPDDRRFAPVITFTVQSTTRWAVYDLNTQGIQPEGGFAVRGNAPTDLTTPALRVSGMEGQPYELHWRISLEDEFQWSIVGGVQQIPNPISFTNRVPAFSATGQYPVMTLVLFMGVVYRALNPLDGSTTTLANPDVDTTNWSAVTGYNNQGLPVFGETDPADLSATLTGIAIRSERLTRGTISGNWPDVDGGTEVVTINGTAGTNFNVDLINVLPTENNNGEAVDPWITIDDLDFGGDTQPLQIPIGETTYQFNVNIPSNNGDGVNRSFGIRATPTHGFGPVVITNNADASELLQQAEQVGRVGNLVGAIRIDTDPGDSDSHTIRVDVSRGDPAIGVSVYGPYNAQNRIAEADLITAFTTNIADQTLFATAPTQSETFTNLQVGPLIDSSTFNPNQYYYYAVITDTDHVAGTNDILVIESPVLALDALLAFTFGDDDLYAPEAARTGIPVNTMKRFNHITRNAGNSERFTISRIFRQINSQGVVISSAVRFSNITPSFGAPLGGNVYTQNTGQTPIDGVQYNTAYVGVGGSRWTNTGVSYFEIFGFNNFNYNGGEFATFDLRYENRNDPTNDNIEWGNYRLEIYDDVNPNVPFNRTFISPPLTAELQALPQPPQFAIVNNSNASFNELGVVGGGFDIVRLDDNAMPINGGNVTGGTATSASANVTRLIAGSVNTPIIRVAQSEVINSGVAAIGQRIRIAGWVRNMATGNATNIRYGPAFDFTLTA